jgi:hypothetical protein
MASCVVSSYLLIELNTAYSLIRQRTTLHLSIYVLLTAASFPLPLTVREVWMAPLFLLALHQLFATYESSRAPVGVFNTYFCLSVGSLLCPPMAWLAPVFLIGFYQMRALTLRSFLAALIGFAAPWWCYYGYLYGFTDQPVSIEPMARLVAFSAPNYQAVSAAGYCLWGVLVGAALVSCIHYVVVSYMDKVRTRVYLSFLIFLQIVLLAMAAAQPHYEAVLWTLQLPLTTLLVSHLFMLTRTRIISYCFLFFMILFLVLPVITLWIV